VKVQLETVIERLRAKKIQLEIDEGAIALLAKKGFDPIYGARPLKRVIQTDLLNPLSKKMIAGEIKSGDSLKVSSKGTELVFK